MSEKKIFENNKFVVLLSIVIAIIAFFVIKITEFPETTTVVKNVPVTIDLTGTAAERADLSIIGDTEYAVDVTLKGQRYLIGNLTAEDIQIRAKTAVVTEADTYALELEIVNPMEAVIYELTPQTVTVTFDTIVSREIAVTAETGDLTVPEGFIQETPFTQPDKVTIKGPKADVERIVTCVAKADISGKLEETTVKKGELSFYDKDNNKLEFGNVLAYTPQSVDVTVPVYKQKTVPLTVDFTNVPDGFPIDKLNYKLSQTQITIATPNNAVDGISELSLGSIDFRKVDIGSVITMDVTLPSSYRNVSNLNQVTVEFPSSGMSSKTVTLTDLKLANVPSNYAVSLITNRLNRVKIVGQEGIVKSITAQDIIATIDLLNTTVTKGQFSVPVKISIPNKGLVWAAGEYNAVIRATEK